MTVQGNQGSRLTGRSVPGEVAVPRELRESETPPSPPTSMCAQGIPESRREPSRRTRGTNARARKEPEKLVRELKASWPIPGQSHTGSQIVTRARVRFKA